MNKLTFSVVIPTLNEEKYLPYLLDDLSKQTFTGFEVVVVDGNSEDGTVKKCLECKKKLPLLRLIISKKRNVSYQRNFGAKCAKGEWVIFMDADNRLPNYFLDGINYRILKDNPDCFTTYCNSDKNHPSDKALINFINLSIEITNLLETPTASGSMIGIKRNLFNRYQGFDESVGFAEDSEYIKRLFKKGFNFSIFKDPRYTYSLRHYRRLGRLQYMEKTARLHLKNLAGMKIDQMSEYPMGGSFEDKKNNNGLDFLFKDIKLVWKKPRIVKKIKEYIRYLEEDF